ncbi:GxGYxYP domain-containing protein [Paenibacillus hamazuiensis]|uniref:GxGYxYP domain-containing protein n=1 Tax=Paenibacillus hamazuiensis TaxID=2936508 RepID=UPI00200ED523|nr:GxGYxYP domain-containing protein [Paenibacillus hamazuiensis]
MKLNVRTKAKWMTVLLLIAATFGFGGTAGMEQGNGTFYPKSPGTPDHVYAIRTKNMSLTEAAMISTLQGLLAKEKPEIYMKSKEIDEYWQKELTEQYNVKFEEAKDAWELIDRYKDRINGYILYDFEPVGKNDKRSGQLTNTAIHVATSLAGLLNAVIVDTQLEQTAIDHGLTKVLDVSGKDESWLLESEYFPKLNKKLAFEVENLESYAYKMRDYAVMTNGMMFFTDDGGLRKRIVDSLEPNSPLFGWGRGGTGEANFAMPTTQSGKFMIPSNLNMSFFSGFRIDKLQQQTHRPAPEADPAKHYVTIMMSDGGNLGYTMGGLASQGRLFDSPGRGSVDLGWGLHPAMIDIAPTSTKSLYDRASNGEHKDQFILSQPGGYIYPGKYPKEHLDELLQKVDGYMDRMDLGIMSIIDFGQENNKELWDHFTKMEHLKAVFFLDYLGYSTPGGKILWSNGKPVIPSKEMFKEGLALDEDVLARINASPADPASPDGYTLIVAHNWTKSVDQVKEFVGKLDAHVQVVPPETFVDLIVKNVKREVYVPEDTSGDLFRFTFENDMEGWAAGARGTKSGSAKWVFNGHPGGGIFINGPGKDESKPNAWMSRAFELPSDAKTLEFEDRTRSENHGGKLRVRVKDAAGTMHVLRDWSLDRGNAYVKRSVDISRFAGQRVEVYFEQVASDKGDSEQIYLDNIVIKKG